MPEQPPDGPTPDEASAAPAAGSSTGSSAASSFFAPDGAGPTFDGDAGERVDAPELAAAPDQAGLQWETATVEGLLIAKGATLHALVGVGDQDWIYTQQELRAIAPPLTRILNRYPVTAAAAAAGDELALIIGLSGYAKRSYDERAAILKARKAAEQGTSFDPTEPLAAPAAAFAPTPQPPAEVSSWQ